MGSKDKAKIHEELMSYVYMKLLPTRDNKIPLPVISRRLLRRALQWLGCDKEISDHNMEAAARIIPKSVACNDEEMKAAFHTFRCGRAMVRALTGGRDAVSFMDFWPIRHIFMSLPPPTLVQPVALWRP